ncbi:alpha/beta hydrolase [Saccharopolyspora sp. K220]|uniref:alpha/beta hydrolase fold domain-containing protein n=1 Tax=Saccharopolyspora soli TaxID=2926618 RepID=UPI001F5793D1|nr:alpha/beta hydrolase fold domain-containing protein [Saccharopolyspora soli]MCI2423377.1 alpha/beta hydrolase [Saccharopolyspora soli]
MRTLSAELTEAHQLLTTMGEHMPVDDRPEHVRHRDAYRRWSEQFPVPADAVITEAPGFPGRTVTTPASTADRVLLYFHGGGYTEGASYNHREMGARLATAARGVVHLPDYPLAPEHRFPAALDAAVVAYRAVLTTVQADRIAVGGDSAGGGLSLALLLRLKELGLALPAAAVPVSPWTDLTVSAPSFADRADRDPFVTQEGLRSFAANYLGAHDPRDPLASPLFGDLTGLPPIHIEVGTEEVMIDDSLNFHERALAAGVASELVVTGGAPHIWQHFASFLPEAAASIDRIGDFVREHVA